MLSLLHCKTEMSQPKYAPNMLSVQLKKKNHKTDDKQTPYIQFKNLNIQEIGFCRRDIMVNYIRCFFQKKKKKSYYNEIYKNLLQNRTDETKWLIDIQVVHEQVQRIKH